RAHIEARGGRLIDTAGDSLLAEFGSALEAVDCATHIQSELGKRNSQLAEHRKMNFRIGISLGDVIEQEDGTLYGDGVNIAARLQQLAEPGGIYISGTVYDHVEGKLPVAIAFMGKQTVKNIPKPVRAYRVQAGAGAAIAPKPCAGNRQIALAGFALGVVLAIALGVVWIAQRSEPGHSASAVIHSPQAGSEHRPRLYFGTSSNVSGLEAMKRNRPRPVFSI
ncbi:MAG: adenylate/guanylate cyclase domain-containing protein, partial [Burkholderiales bacterium]